MVLAFIDKCIKKNTWNPFFVDFSMGNIILVESNKNMLPMLKCHTIYYGLHE
jgi:hypothetical protein